ncbi:MAG: ATP-binding protein [Saprospiraceae bacterium]|jgi:predicted ATP-dependent endonuclease of OLD family|nr:ATP-binding protein [Saprospiraceae bacterium]
MKIKELSLRNYKRFVNPKRISFCEEEGNPNEMTLLVGDNGSGKSSILQAIAMVVGGAVKPHFRPSELEYPGFQYNYIQTGRLPIDVRAKIQFSEDERAATREFSDELARRYPENSYIQPANLPEIELKLDYEENSVKSSTRKAFLQTKGYQYALQLSAQHPDPSQMFSRVGSIFWYTEQRTFTSITPRAVANGNGEPSLPPKADENTVREFLIKWYRFHDNLERGRFEQRPGQKDIYSNLASVFNQVFRPKQFVGPAPKMGINQIFDIEDFWISEGTEQYEIGSMSGAERALFPILVDFANWQINNSIILIDELELHLHPPLQQALIRMLPLLGNNNQFIITTHSDDVATMFTDEQIIRLDE